MHILRTSVVAAIPIAIAFVTTTAFAVATHFGAGTQIAGRDVEPGTYESGVVLGDGTCRWDRLNGFCGEMTSSLATS